MHQHLLLLARVGATTRGGRSNCTQLRSCLPMHMVPDASRRNILHVVTAQCLFHAATRRLEMHGCRGVAAVRMESTSRRVGRTEVAATSDVGRATYTLCKVRRHCTVKTEGGTSISVSPHRSATTDKAVVVVAVAHDDVRQPRITQQPHQLRSCLPMHMVPVSSRRNIFSHGDSAVSLPRFNATTGNARLPRTGCCADRKSVSSRQANRSCSDLRRWPCNVYSLQGTYGGIVP